MPNTFVVGMYWGDCGKGKIIDALASGIYGDFYATVRATGGNNAGHTIIVFDEELITHLIPSGIANPKMWGILGNGMVISLEGLVKEIEEIERRGMDLKGRLFISDRAHAVMPYHLILDGGSHSKEIGTTGRGIGPAYTDKVAREGIRLSAFFHPDLLRELILRNIERKIILNDKVKELDPDAILKQQLGLFERIEEYVTDTSLVIDKIRQQSKSILFEGAQGTMLSIDHGTYPKVTSSDSCAGGICTGSGFGPVYMHKGIGIAKAYPTRVGNGPFPTELGGVKSEAYCDEEGGKKYSREVESGMYNVQQLIGSGNDFNLGVAIRRKGDEYGATTGRPRRCGWPDLMVLNYARRVNGLNEIALTKLDVLGGIPDIKICTGYKLDGKDIESVPAEECDLRRVEPVYIHLPGWEGSISDARTFGQLPPEARDVVKAIEKGTGLPVKMIGVGPKRDQLIIRD